MTTIELAQIFFRIAREWQMPVDAQNKPLPCRRLNTFSVIHSESQLETENLEKIQSYKNKNIFYSRKWEATGFSSSSIAVEYPALNIWEEGGQISKKPNSLNCQDYVFCFLDKMPSGDKSCTNCTYCDLRVYEEVAQDLKFIANTVLSTLKTFHYYTLLLGGITVGQGWYTQADVNAMIVAALIDNYTESIELWSLFSNITTQIVPHAFKDDLLAFFIRLTLCDENCESPLELTTVKDINKNYSGCCP